ncbi:dihydrofolate reductase [Paenibacillus sp. GCM10027627]|uniref:dihydrofolate reductase n=1 Tax=unclassified Paenibacillus TaxID=185978 RepID=UPI00363232CB
MAIAMIAAMDRNRTIGIGNKMPWHLPAELAYFKANTTGKTVLMGRKTFQSLGKPLPNRKNVVLTRQRGLELAGCEVIHTVEEALEQHGSEELMIIGGAEIYELFLPYADTILLTDVEVEVSGGDAFFPEMDAEEWKLTESEHRERDEKNPFAFTFQTYKRV